MLNLSIAAAVIYQQISHGRLTLASTLIAPEPYR
jgi:hypothetical protein